MLLISDPSLKDCTTGDQIDIAELIICLFCGSNAGTTAGLCTSADRRRKACSVATLSDRSYSVSCSRPATTRHAPKPGGDGSNGHYH